MKDHGFYDALTKGNLEQLKQFMPQDVNALVLPDNELHPLQEVFLSSRAMTMIPVDIVEHLLVSGANPNFHENGVWPPLFLALNCIRPNEAVKLLISHGANVNFVYKGGMYPMFLAIRKQSKNLDLIELMVNSGAEIRPEGCRDDIDTFIAMKTDEVRRGLFTVLGI